MRVLFICNQNLNRSKTAERIFKEDFEVRSAGLRTLDIKRLLTEEMLGWADVIYVMEEEQRSEIAKRFPKLYMKKKIICLDIPDKYLCMDEELIKILKEKVKI